MNNEPNFPKRLIFDSHSHFGLFGENIIKNHLVNPFANGREISSLKDLQIYMQTYDLAKVLIVPHYTPDQNKPFNIYNSMIINTVINSNNVLGGLWVSPLSQVWDKTKQVLASLPLHNIVALKISPDSWEKGITLNPQSWNLELTEHFEMIVEACIKNNLVLHIHTGTGNSDVLTFDPFVKKYGSNLKIQFVHMGGSMGGHLAFVPRFIQWLKDGHNFYCDTSNSKGFGPAWLVNEMKEQYPRGLKNILFASDNPWGDFKSEFWKIENIKCDDSIKNNIYYYNAQKLYCLK